MLDDVISPSLWRVTHRAFWAAKSAGDAYLTAGKYIGRLSKPDWRINSSGWPACVGGSRLLGAASDPPDWREMFSVGTPVGGGLSIAEVPGLESACSDVVELAMSDPAIERAVSIASLAYKDNPEERGHQIAFEFLRTLGTLLNRADALDSWGKDEVQAIYREWEKGAFLPELPGDLIIPIVLGALPDDVSDLHLSENMRIERMDAATQVARAPRLDTAGAINPFLRAAATHAIVVADVSINSEWLRWTTPRDELDLTAVEAALEALSILTGDPDIGYADIFVRPHGWSTKWVGDLPALIRLTGVEKVPRNRGANWNDQRTPYDAERVAYLPTAFQRLQDAASKVRLASRRVVRAALRDDAEDAFLDAMIGVEALLGRERNEITYRLALRAATVLARQWGAGEVSALVTFLYGQRSAIVHGAGRVKESVSFHGTEYATHVLAPWLLRELFQNWLTAPEPWTPADLDNKLLSRLTDPSDRQDGPEG